MSEKKTVVIIGARLDGHAGVVLDALEAIGTYVVKGFIDNTPELAGKKVSGIPVLGTTDDLATMPIPADCVHIAIGDNVARGGLFKTLKKRGITVETVIHPSAQVSANATVGQGCFVAARAVVNNGAQVGLSLIHI